MIRGSPPVGSVRSAGDLVAGVFPGPDNPTGGKDPHRAFRRRRHQKAKPRVDPQKPSTRGIAIRW